MAEQLRLFNQIGGVELDPFVPGACDPIEYQYYNHSITPRGQRSLWLGSLAYNGEHVPNEVEVVELPRDNVIDLFPERAA